MTIRHWTDEEVEILKENYGQVTLRSLMTKLDRSEGAIVNKVAKLKLGRWYHNLENPTANEFSKATGIATATLIRWSKYYGFPIKEKRLREHYVKTINIDDFWKWAKTHKNMIEWDKVEKYILGAEPDWVQSARDAAFKAKDKSVKRMNWTKGDDEKLIWMLKQYKYTYPQIAKELGRTHGAIKKRMTDKGIKLRPIYLENKKRYTNEEVELILDMYQKGNSFKVIAEILNRSEAGVRGKIERMGYVFKNRVIQKKPTLQQQNRPTN